MPTATPPPAECDLAVVGGGILGLAVARELLGREPEARLCVLEAERDLALHQSGHSSGVIHAGVYYEPGTLKAKLCVEGAARLYRYLEERGLPHRRAGKLIVATTPGEVARLDELERRARANGVPGVRRLSGGEIPEVEPNARGLAALHSPETGIVDFRVLAASYAEDVERAGGTIHLGAGVAHLHGHGDRLHLHLANGAVSARRAVFCAGLMSDRLALEDGGPAEPRIVPFLGSYLEVRPDLADLVRANVYPVPDPELPFLGAHLTRFPDGRLMIGPTALMALSRDGYAPWKVNPGDALETLGWPGTWKLLARHWRAARRELRHAIEPAAVTRQAARMVPALRPELARPGPAGLRAQALSRDGRLLDDFLIDRTEHAVHVRNAPSPAATSSLALAELIADRLAA